MALNMNRVAVGTTSPLTEYAEHKRERRSPKVWVTYEDEEGVDRYVETCAYGARVLAKALTENANIVDPPPKPRRRKA